MMKDQPIFLKKERRKVGESSSTPGFRFDNIGHFPVHSEP